LHLPNRFEARKRPTAAAKLVRRDSEPLQHAHIEVAQRRRVLRVEVQVLSVPEAAAGQEYGQVLDGVAAAVAQGGKGDIVDSQ
jgi:hypothetical protein